MQNHIQAFPKIQNYKDVQNFALSGGPKVTQLFRSPIRSFKSALSIRGGQAIPPIVIKSIAGLLGPKGGLILSGVYSAYRFIRKNIPKNVNLKDLDKSRVGQGFFKGAFENNSNEENNSFSIPYSPIRISTDWKEYFPVAIFFFLLLKVFPQNKTNIFGIPIRNDNSLEKILETIVPARRKSFNDLFLDSTKAALNFMISHPWLIIFLYFIYLFRTGFSTLSGEKTVAAVKEVLLANQTALINAYGITVDALNGFGEKFFNLHVASVNRDIETLKSREKEITTLRYTLNIKEQIIFQGQLAAQKNEHEVNKCVGDLYESHVKSHQLTQGLGAKTEFLKLIEPKLEIGIPKTEANKLLEKANRDTLVGPLPYTENTIKNQYPITKFDPKEFEKV